MTKDVTLSAKELYSLVDDHASIKKQIKKWELSIDDIREDIEKNEDVDYFSILDVLELMSEEMMAINV